MGSFLAEVSRMILQHHQLTSCVKMAPIRHVGMKNVRLTGVVKLLICMVAIVKLCAAADDSETETSATEDPREDQQLFFDQFYVEGVKAYNEQLWYKCAYNLEKAVSEYNKFKRTLTDCRLKCKRGEEDSHLDKMLSELKPEFGLFAKFLKHADCFRRCKSDAYDRRPGLRLTKEVETTFESRKPYQYLQFCWYKLDRVKQAASASYTFYLANPGDEDVKTNIAFYRDKAHVAENDFIDLELQPYKEHYIRALLAHNDEDWVNVVDNMEKCVSEFFVEEERCRADCEDSSIDLQDPSHFTGLIADHFLKVLECQLGCEGNLSVVYTDPISGFLATQFHYLQYAYYKSERIQDAVEATASFLSFYPDDHIVQENKNIFKKKYQYDDDQFVPRSAVKQYVERREKLQELLDYLGENLMPNVPDLVFVTADDAEGEEVKREWATKPTTDYQTWMERYERLGLHLIAKENDLKRKYRFAADGLLKQEQCEDILSLLDDVDMDKKGVKEFTLEHARETVVLADENYEASMRLFMRATEVMRHYTQRYYNFSGSLYFKNTKMVCWQHLDAPEVENACIPQEFGSCDPEINVKGSQVLDDQFVTVTYLNSLDDADFYFLAENISVDAALGVKTGRTIGFQAGDRHGLHIPTSGSRCALIITYTTYKSDDELDYTNTIHTLQRLDQLRSKINVQSRDDVMKRFDEMGVKIVRNSSTLHPGGERFVADGLASDAECTSLRNMVMELGKVGDGYDGKKSPHTRHELFSGLSLQQLTQSGALVGDGYDHLESKPSFISPHTEHETFHGLTIYRAAKLMHMGLASTSALQSFLDLSENSRLLVEKYFNLSSHLYFDFTHLVCRSAVDDSKERTDLSHPVHADNCVLKPDGSCVREYPAFTQRDYSALLYLNDDFDGGEFFFAHWNTTEQVSLQPKCGRLVGFNATQFHGVKAVRKGTRCALALWFTLNPAFKEIAHLHAKKVLRNVLAEREGVKMDSLNNSAKDLDSESKTSKEIDSESNTAKDMDSESNMANEVDSESKTAKDSASATSAEKKEVDKSNSVDAENDNTDTDSLNSNKENAEEKLVGDEDSAKSFGNDEVSEKAFDNDHLTLKEKDLVQNENTVISVSTDLGDDDNVVFGFVEKNDGYDNPRTIDSLDDDDEDFEVRDSDKSSDDDSIENRDDMLEEGEEKEEL